MGFLNFECVARQESRTGQLTLYGISFGVRKGDNENGPGDPPVYLLLVKSNTSPKSVRDITWTLVNAIPRDYLYYMRSRDTLKGFHCTVDEEGSFTLMVFNSAGQPFVSHYVPVSAINATHTTGGIWWNAVLEINYQWDMATSYLFNVPSPNSSEPSQVYHSFIDGNGMVNFGRLNSVTRTMENYAVMWNMTVISPGLSYKGSHYYNNTLHIFGATGSRFSLVLLPLPFHNKAPIPNLQEFKKVSWTPFYSLCQYPSITALDDYVFTSCSGGQTPTLFVYDGTHALQPLFINSLEGQLSYSFAFSSDFNLTVNNGNSTNDTSRHSPYLAVFEENNWGMEIGSRQSIIGLSLNAFSNDTIETRTNYFINISSEYGLRENRDSLLPTLPPTGEWEYGPLSNSGLVAGVIINFLAFLTTIAFCCWKRRRSARKEAQIVDEVEKNEDNHDTNVGAAASNDEAVAQKQPVDDGDEQQLQGKVENEEADSGDPPNQSRADQQKEEGNLIEMSILSGPVAAPPVPDYAVSTTSRPSTMGQVRQRRQLIVLSNHPRPSIITTIDQGDTAEGEVGGNDDETEEDQEPLEEWIPKPFDPRAQPNLGLSLAPPASTSTRTTAAPSAPPLPLITGVSEESRPESIHSTTDTVHDGEEPPPSYEDRSLGTHTDFDSLYSR